MKRLILASLIASSFASADDANKDTGWDFGGQAVAYYQTNDGYGNSDLFKQNTSHAALGLQLRAINKDVFAGIGAGFELSSLSAGGLHHNIVSEMVQNAGGTTGAAITQAYLTYGFDNTSFKIGRQHLPKSLSPLAYTVGFNPFKSSFEAALMVNTDIPDTTVAVAYVTKANSVIGDLTDFNKIWNADSTFMISALNKSIENVTLTGSFYNLFDVAQTGEGQQAIWGDVKYDFANSIKVEGQIGRIYGDFTDSVGGKDTKAVGFRISRAVGDIKLALAYSNVNKGTINAANVAGSGIKSPLYTQGVFNQNGIKRDANSVKFSANIKRFGGTVIAAYMTSDLGSTALPSVFGLGVGGAGTYNEFDIMFKTKVSDNINMFFGYFNQTDDRQVDDNQHFFRVWARYTF